MLFYLSKNIVLWGKYACCLPRRLSEAKKSLMKKDREVTYAGKRSCLFAAAALLRFHHHSLGAIFKLGTFPFSSALSSVASVTMALEKFCLYGVETR